MREYLQLLVRNTRGCAGMATVDNSKYYIIFLFGWSTMPSFSVSGLTEGNKMRRAN